MTGTDQELIERLGIMRRALYRDGLTNAAIYMHEAADALQSRISEVERLRERVRDYGDAIDFACDHAGEMRFFLEDWRKDGAEEWDDFQRWRELQRTGAALSQHGKV